MLFDYGRQAGKNFNLNYHLVAHVLTCIGRAERCTDEWLEKNLRSLLWGFPELLRTFYDEVHPILAPIRAQNLKDIEEERNGGGNVSSLARSGNRGDDGVPNLSWIVHDFLSACAAVDAHARVKDKTADTEGSSSDQQAEHSSQPANPRLVRGNDLETTPSGTAYD